MHNAEDAVSSANPTGFTFQETQSVSSIRDPYPSVFFEKGELIALGVIELRMIQPVGLAS